MGDEAQASLYPGTISRNLQKKGQFFQFSRVGVKIRPFLFGGRNPAEGLILPMPFLFCVQKRVAF
jgi:hypothetical protein